VTRISAGDQRRIHDVSVIEVAAQKGIKTIQVGELALGGITIARQ